MRSYKIDFLNLIRCPEDYAVTGMQLIFRYLYYFLGVPLIMIFLLLFVFFGLLCNLQNLNAQFPPVYLKGDPHLIGRPQALSEPYQDLYPNKSITFLADPMILISTADENYSNKNYSQKGPYSAAIVPLTYHMKYNKFMLQVRLPLTFVRNNASRFSYSEFGLNDTNFMFGYRFYSSPTCSLGSYADLVIPAALGSAGRTFGCTALTPGLGLYATKQIVGHARHNLVSSSSLVYRYQFGCKAGLSNSTYNFSGVNIVDAVTNLMYTYHSFFVNVGCFYHFLAKQKILFTDLLKLKYKPNEYMYFEESKFYDCEQSLFKLLIEIGGKIKKKTDSNHKVFDDVYCLVGGSIIVAGKNTSSEWALFSKFGTSF